MLMKLQFVDDVKICWWSYNMLMKLQIVDDVTICWWNYNMLMKIESLSENTLFWWRYHMFNMLMERKNICMLMGEVTIRWWRYFWYVQYVEKIQYFDGWSYIFHLCIDGWSYNMLMKFEYDDEDTICLLAVWKLFFPIFNMTLHSFNQFDYSVISTLP